MDDHEVVAEELSQLAGKMRDLEDRLAEVERVNARLDEAADHGPWARRGLTSLGCGVRRMRRADKIDKRFSSERDHGCG